jgi:hypothetical protein
MTEGDWNLLLRRIAGGACTPFLGAGVSAGVLPLAGELAAKWALEHGYPLADPPDLAQVAQYVGVTADDLMLPKELMKGELEGRTPPNFVGVEPHSVLARLPLPIYITTNYDPFMYEALAHERKEPRRDLCRWNRSPAVAAFLRENDLSSFVPTVANPLVFHLHGSTDVPESMVLTEDDYLDFLVTISQDTSILPHQIQRALAGSSLLFVGYSLADWDFRVIHRGLVTTGEPSLRRLSVTVQLPRDARGKAYLDQYFGSMRLRVYWGTAEDFVSELDERWAQWKAHESSGAPSSSH